MISYTGLRQVPRIDLASAVPLAKPLAIHIEPTNICNLKCSFCPVSLPTYAEDSGFHHHMQMGLYSKIIDDLKEIGGVCSLKMYFIGEPFLHPQLLRMIEMANNAGIAERIEMTTNGTKLPLETVNAGLDYLRISVYVAKPTKITRNVDAIVKHRNSLGLSKPFICVKYMPSSEEDKQDFLKTYDGICDELIVERYHNWASTQGLTHIQVNPMTKQNCPFVHYMLVIKADGKVVPCCVDWNAELQLGDLRKQTIKEVWEGDPRNKLVVEHIEHRRSAIRTCAGCDLPETTPDNLDGLTLGEYERRMK